LCILFEIESSNSNLKENSIGNKNRKEKKNKEKEHYLRLGRIPPVSAHTLFNRAAHRTTLSRTRSPTCGPHLAAAFPRAHVGPSLRYTVGFAADNMGPGCQWSLQRTCRQWWVGPSWQCPAHLFPQIRTEARPWRQGVFILESDSPRQRSPWNPRTVNGLGFSCHAHINGALPLPFLHRFEPYPGRWAPLQGEARVRSGFGNHRRRG
jgi:hypothetical protein